MKSIIYDKQHFNIEKLCLKSDYFMGLKDFPSTEIEQDVTYRGEAMLIVLNFLTSQIIPEIKTPEIAYQILELNSELLINDDTLHKHITSLFENHLNTCIVMFYNIECINSKYDTSWNYKSLTKKQKNSSEYMKNYYKKEEQWNNNKQNYLLDYNYDYNHNISRYSKACSNIWFKSIYLKSDYTDSESIWFKSIYSESIYNNFIDSCEWIIIVIILI